MKKTYIYGVLLVLGLLAFILQLFVFEAPDGALGFLLCLTSITTVIVSTIQLCRTSKKVKNVLLGMLEAIFGTL